MSLTLSSYRSAYIHVQQARWSTPICISLSPRSFWIPNELLRQSENVVTKSRNLYLRVAWLCVTVLHWNFPSYLDFPWTWYEWKNYEIWWYKTWDINVFWNTTLRKQAVYFFLTVPWPALNKHEMSYTYSRRSTPYMVEVFAWFSV